MKEITEALALNPTQIQEQIKIRTYLLDQMKSEVLKTMFTKHLKLLAARYEYLTNKPIII